MKHKSRKNLLAYFAKNFMIAVGIILIWRGIWHGLDQIDILFFGGNTLVTSLGGIVAGLLILYLPDKDLDELERL